MMREHCSRTPASDTNFARMSAEVTEDPVLGGKLRLKQPTRGHRFGHDAILLAAACPARQRASPDRQRRLAHAGSAETLSVWIKAAARLLAPHGTVSMIWRGDGLAEVLPALAPAFGAATVLPVHPTDREPAGRVLVRA